MLFFGRRGNRARGVAPDLLLNGQVIERVSEFRFLGVWFDDKMTWKVHVQRVAASCTKALNIMRRLCDSSWGASVAALRSVYSALLRSRLDYGCIVYGWAREGVLRPLLVIHNQALRICCGAVCSSSRSAVQVEVGEKPLLLRFNQLALNYWAYLQGHDSERHPAVEVLTESWESTALRRGRCFAWDVQGLVGQSGLSRMRFCRALLFSPTPFWFYPDVVVDFHFLEEQKVGKSAVAGVGLVEARLSLVYPMYEPIYTDGSKDQQAWQSSFLVVEGMLNSVCLIICLFTRRSSWL